MQFILIYISIIYYCMFCILLLCICQMMGLLWTSCNNCFHLFLVLDWIPLFNILAIITFILCLGIEMANMFITCKWHFSSPLQVWPNVWLFKTAKLGSYNFFTLQMIYVYPLTFGVALCIQTFEKDSGFCLLAKTIYNLLGL